MKKTTDFQLDIRLESSSFKLIDWPLSRVLLKNNAYYPWFILVPRVNNITEITELSNSDRYQLMDEMQHLSTIIQDKFKPDKINIGALGNIVQQLHVHVVARFKDDNLWPQGIWQNNIHEKPYIDPTLLIDDLINSSLAIFSRAGRPEERA